MTTTTPHTAGQIPILPVSPVEPHRPIWALLIWHLAAKLMAIPGAITAALLIQRWSRRELEERNDLAREVLAADDPIEAIEPDLAKALVNDSARVRRRILRAWAEARRRVAVAGAHCAVPTLKNPSP